MDAISFVLGVKSAQLRSSQLKDLVYRGRRLARGPTDGSEDTGDQDDAQDDSDGEEGQGEGTAKKAWVLAVYEDENKKEWFFQRMCVSRVTLASPRGSHRFIAFLPLVHPSIVSTTRLSRMLPTILLSSRTTSLSKQKTSSSSREMWKPLPPNHRENLPVSLSKSLVPSSWRQITRRQRKHKNELPRTLRSILRRGGVSLVKYDSIKNKRAKQNTLRVSVKKKFVPLR